MTELGFVYRFEPAKSNRTLLLLHGTGGDENDLIDVGRAIDPAAALLSPRGKVLENGAPRFFRRLAEGVFDEPDVIRRAHELAEFVNGAVARYAIDPNHLIALGYSNGANIAAAMLLLGIANFPGAILFRAMVPLSQLDAVPDLTSIRLLLSAGKYDPIAQPQIVGTLAGLLRQGGAQVAVEIQSSGHELTARDVASAQAWLAGER